MRKIALSILTLLLIVQQQESILSQNQQGKKGNFFTQRKPTINNVQKSSATLVPNSLFLSSSEVKLFAGHVFNLLRTKCPNVNSTRIFLLQRRISTRATASIHQASEKKSAINALLKSLRFCNSRPDHRLLNGQWTPSQLEQVFRTVGDGVHFILDVTGLDHLVQSIVQDARTRAESIKNYMMTQFRSARRAVSFQNIFGKFFTLPEPFSISTFLSFLRRGKETVKIRIKAIFKIKPTLETPSKNDEKKNLDTDPLEPSVVVDVENMPGGLRFHKLLDELFKLYSKNCGSSHKLKLFFLAASQDLLALITYDKIFANQAGEYHLTKDFMQNVTQCANGLSQDSYF